MSAKLSTVTRLSLAALFATTVACDLDPTAPPRTYPIVSTNAATVNSSLIPELNLAGMVGDDGVSFVAAVGPGGDKNRLTVTDGELVAYNPGGPVAHGAEMVGWTLVIKKDGVASEILIKGHEAGAVSKYAFAIRDDQGELVNLCPAFADSPELPTATLIFGERYDAETKEVIPEQESWLNIACQGEALFKMKALGYVPDETKAIRRQATLKMLTADYCGSGHSFTKDGTEVIWQNVEGTIGQNAGEVGELEAVWNEYGAICLSTPRIASLGDIAEHCSLPVCDEEILAKAAATDFAWKTWTP